ncbi:MAG: hypothetical protein EOO87_11000 [Pedobacter sp.]|nr:MAG: hypothetical protein EOO87_11000 [Pedobacter sp.]
MYIYKNYTVKGLLQFSGFHLLWLTLWAIIVASLYQFTPIREFNVPWLPISVIGTSVAFYVGFKNNQAYDRYWEARKIWGSIINSSRMWGSMVEAYIKNWEDKNHSDTAIAQFKKDLIYRNIAWTYTLRDQLLQVTSWEHQGLANHVGNLNRGRAEKEGIGLVENGITAKQQKKYLSEYEFNQLASFKNGATQINHAQAKELADLNKIGLVDNFRQVEMQKILNDFYDNQGKAERIKRTPLPRQYAAVGFIFVCIFIVLFPFSMVSEFAKIGSFGIWLSVPFVALTGWIFVMIELVGDYTKNPFEGLSNDVPMNSICRTIEIDLLQMLGETDLPKPIKPIDGFLM